jgi:hypothetical protein
MRGADRHDVENAHDTDADDGVPLLDDVME